MRGHTLFFASCMVSCNAWIFTRPISRSESKFDMAREHEPPTVPPLDNRAAELEAMGGDPFFLSDESNNDDDTIDTPSQEDGEISLSDISPEFIIAAAAVSPNGPINRFMIEGLEPIPRILPPTHGSGTKNDDEGDWEWDGVIDENAFMDLDDW
jgi:hypothetical protein